MQTDDEDYDDEDDPVEALHEAFAQHDPVKVAKSLRAVSRLDAGDFDLLASLFDPESDPHKVPYRLVFRKRTRGRPAGDPGAKRTASERRAEWLETAYKETKSLKAAKHELAKRLKSKGAATVKRDRENLLKRRKQKPASGS